MFNFHLHLPVWIRLGKYNGYGKLMIIFTMTTADTNHLSLNVGRGCKSCVANSPIWIKFHVILMLFCTQINDTKIMSIWLHLIRSGPNAA